MTTAFLTPLASLTKLGCLRRERWGKRGYMASDVEIERALATVTATLNDQQLDGFDTDRIQELVDESLGGKRKMTVDDGGGLHDSNGRRLGAIRRTDSGEWITERQNPAAEHSDKAIPRPHPRASCAP
jgi:hypothetical protein